MPKTFQATSTPGAAKVLVFQTLSGLVVSEPQALCALTPPSPEVPYD